MDIIFNNHLSLLIDILPIYLNPKQCVKFYSSNKELYIIYNKYNKFEHSYFTPKTKNILKIAIDNWCIDKKNTILHIGDINFWNTSYIGDMSYLFYDKSEFNDNISDWNTSNVRDMRDMFAGATIFNQPINNWNVINVSKL